MTSVKTQKKPTAPLSLVLIPTIAQLVDEARGKGFQKPSHDDITFLIERHHLTPGDPRAEGQPMGKMRRVRSILNWALDNDPENGEAFLAQLISEIRGIGGFQVDSQNYCGAEAIKNAIAAFKTEGFELTEDEELLPQVLENLHSVALTEALEAYIRRAKRGALDAALLTGTGKDLLEATAAHILMERYGAYNTKWDFPTLLANAFLALELATESDKRQAGERPQKQFERQLFQAACAVNSLRNKEGTGHGHPWLPSVTNTAARAAVETMGVVAELLLDTHKERC